MKGEFEPEEYKTEKDETLEQLKEFQASLSKMLEGNMSLVDEINGMQLVRTPNFSENSGAVHFGSHQSILCQPPIVLFCCILSTGHTSRSKPSVQDP